MLKKILVPALIVALLAGGFAYYLYNKPATKTEDRSSDLSVTAEQLFQEYEANEETANQKYLNKVIEISGTIMGTLVEANEFTGVQLKAGPLDQGIICEFEKQPGVKHPRYPVGDPIKLKCKCSGKLMDVVLDRCIVLNQ
jgi:hypothetical protein